MAEIPISPGDLDSVVYHVAQDLIEERAVNGSLDGITEETTREVVADVIFIIERYMYYINDLMDSQARSKIDLQ